MSNDNKKAVRHIVVVPTLCHEGEVNQGFVKYEDAQGVEQFDFRYPDELPVPNWNRGGRAFSESIDPILYAAITRFRKDAVVKTTRYEVRLVEVETA